MSINEIKQNGLYRARLVACGYSQISRVNFLENYSPVMNDIKYCILLLIMIHFGFLAEVVDIETAFLYGYMGEKI